jgi:hypothetical protein
LIRLRLPFKFTLTQIVVIAKRGEYQNQHNCHNIQSLRQIWFGLKAQPYNWLVGL